MSWPKRATRLVLACVVLGASLSLPVAPSSAQVPPPLPDPLERPVWLCRPGMAGNLCNQDAAGNPQRLAGGVFTNRYPSGGDVTLDATRIGASGSTTTEPYPAPANPPIDCFYAYPTVDWYPNPNPQVGSTPPTPQDQEMAAVLGQASRFANLCRLFVPVYRQTPMVTLLGVPFGFPPDFTVGAMDVEQAWLEYWNQYNVDPATGRRRGFVLIGHSQGSADLQTLIQHRIDGQPAVRDHLVSAILPGWDVRVPTGQLSGGGSDPLSTFQHVPGCQRSSSRAPMPVGCVVAYSSYRQPDGWTPVLTALFGHSTIAGHQALCVNPAALLAGVPSDRSTRLDAYFATQRLLGGSPLAPYGFLASFLQGWTIPDRPTGFARYPESLSGRCRYQEDWTGNWSWLNVSGDVGLFPPLVEYSQFGLHNVDVNLALGNLTALVAAQSQAWRVAHP
jgi:hypothetical protein